MDAAGQPGQRGPGTPTPRGRYPTQRRLAVAFAAVLVAFVAALAVQIVAYRRMEAIFDDMKQHEEQMRLVLDLKDAVRDQYRHEAFVMGNWSYLADYEEARSRALALSRTMRMQVSDPEAVGWMHEIDQASEELDKTFRAKAAARAEDAGAPTSDPDLRSYALLMLVEDHVDGFIARLGQATATARAELVALEERAIRWTAILLVVVALLVAVAVLYLSRFVARPLARLSEGAARLAGGDLEAHIDIHTPDEFGALAAKFNSMTVALKQHQEKLVESEKHAGIGRVAAGLAHELNNPLQVMLGYLSLNRDVPDRRLAEQLAAVEEETLRCKEIVESMLEVSRNTTAITQAAVDLRSLCEEVTGKLRGLLPGPIELRVRGAGRAVADPVKLRQAVFNLIKNAVEASGPAGAVRIDVGVAGDTVEVEVGDSGPGIPHEARARLFEPFYTTKATGTGLGLAVSRAIARAQGGDIDFRNREAGGAVFTLRLPRAPEGGA